MEEDQRPPMWSWKRILAVCLLAVVLLVSSFLGGYFHGMHTGKRTRDQQGNISEELFDSEWQRLPCVTEDDVCPEGFTEAPLILISLDGFRADYLSRGLNPSLERLAQCGVKAPFMRPVFPTKTFPNHFTIVTGLWPESHGIVDNKMYDPEFKTLFRIGNTEAYNGRWWEAEPIWLTAEKQGKRASTFFWPGSDVEIKNSRPSEFFKYNEMIPWQTRVEVLLAWLDLPAERRPSLLTLYVNEPDSAGHDHGPHSAAVDEALELVEIMLDRLMAGLQERRLLGCVNLLVVSDHGMASTSCDQVIALEHFIDPGSVYSLVGPTARLRPKQPGDVAQLVESLRCRDSHLLAYAKERLPKRYHYSDHRRIEPVVLDMDSGYLVLNREADKNPALCNGGSHGYDNMAPGMQSLFVAHGPSFRQNVTARPFRSIELYELMTELLGIEPEPNNGTRGSLHYLLRKPKALPEETSLRTPDMCVVDGSKLSEGDKEDGCMCRNTVRPSTAPDALPRHAPWGLPSQEGTEAESDTSPCVLANRDYVTAFDRTLRLPLWTAFTLNGKHEHAIANACWERDARLKGADLSCHDYETLATRSLTKEPLFPPELASSRAEQSAVWLHSNALPFYHNHSAGVRRELLRLVQLWEARHGSLHLVTGPAFDLDGNGRRPPLHTLRAVPEADGVHMPPVPTHVFCVVTRCLSEGVPVDRCSAEKLDAAAFLLPHLPRPENCQPWPQYLLQHSATVGDVELLTGLRFYRDLPRYERIRLRTAIPQALWPAP
uniref:Ectonucleotide pyrophosphatase/phosphodiesterase family member 1/3 n=1 Tax=Rhipicephalus appendiculatus TaxID=34631 RepID=A0A131YMJ5_RHIAP